MTGIRGICTAMLWAIAVAAPAWGDTPRTYVAQYTEHPPLIDGVQSNDDEWTAAAAGGEAWLQLTTRADDPNYNRFDVLWNDDGLFIRHQVEFNGWQDNGTTVWSPLYDNLNFFFDPNTDGEPNEDVYPGPALTSVDSYELAFNQTLGFSEISPSNQTVGMTVAAHVDSRFSNNGGIFSSFADLLMRQTTSAEGNSGYTELFIPWHNFDATDPHDGFDPAVDDIGLYHPEAPEEGEEWYLNVAWASSAGIRAWESPSGTGVLADRPHGILQFAPRPASNACDLNGDIACDALDIDALSTALLEGSLDSTFDINGSGTVDEADRVYYVEVVLHTWFGDGNLDGEFSTVDLIDALAGNTYQDEIPLNSGWAIGDWNGDLNFTTEDLITALAGNGYEKGLRQPAAGTVRPVPEPTGATLWVTALVGLWTRRRQLRGTSHG